MSEPKGRDSEGPREEGGVAAGRGRRFRPSEELPAVFVAQCRVLPSPFPSPDFVQSSPGDGLPPGDDDAEGVGGYDEDDDVIVGPTQPHEGKARGEHHGEHHGEFHGEGEEEEDDVFPGPRRSLAHSDNEGDPSPRTLRAAASMPDVLPSHYDDLRHDLRHNHEKQRTSGALLPSKSKKGKHRREASAGRLERPSAPLPPPLPVGENASPLAGGCLVKECEMARGTEPPCKQPRCAAHQRAGSAGSAGMCGLCASAVVLDVVDVTPMVTDFLVNDVDVSDGEGEGAPAPRNLSAVSKGGKRKREGMEGGERDNEARSLDLSSAALPHSTNLTVQCMHATDLGSILLTRRPVTGVDRAFVIDCRYPYEFQGGHITGALNLYTYALVRGLFDHLRAHGSRVLLVFYCEFSSARAPAMCQRFRTMDRVEHGVAAYPHLDFPHLFVLQGGYKEFFHAFPALCTPMGYTRMDDHPEEVARFSDLANDWPKQ